MPTKLRHRGFSHFVAALFVVSGLSAAAAAQECVYDECASVDEIFGPCEAGNECCGETSGCGDCGLTSPLAESGVTFNSDIANFYFGVVDGGLRRRFRYEGHADYVLNIDAGKAGLQEGLFIKLRAEHRFGQNVGEYVGTLLSPTVATNLPVPDSNELYLTNVLFTQFLSEQFGVFFGKLDTFDGDTNAFASGRGVRQFSNIAFVVNPATLRSIPYSTLGAGFVMIGESGDTFQFTVLNPTNTASTSGFSELFNEGVALAAEYRIPTTFFERPGHQLFGASWNSRDFVALEQDPRAIFPNVPLAETSGSWSAYWNFDQYLHVDECDPTRGWGIFGRAGVADDSNNPIAWFASFGVGGNSPIRGRGADSFGAGWYISGTSDEIGPILETVLGGLQDGQGIELYYNYALTENFFVTPDVQVLMPAREQVETSVLVGVRGVISL